MEVLAPDVLEGVEVAGRREALLRAGDVEADDTGVAPADGALGHLDRAGRLAHGRDEQLHDDGMARGGRPFRADPEPLEHRLDRLVEGQSLLGAQLRGHPDLGVHDAVRGQVLGALGRDPGDRVGPLHDPERVGEGLEVELEALAIGAAAEPRRQLGHVGRRQRVVAILRGQVDDRRRAQAAVEMVVEERLWRAHDGGEIRHDRMVPRRRSARRGRRRTRTSANARGIQPGVLARPRARRRHGSGRCHRRRRTRRGRRRATPRP